MACTSQQAMLHFFLALLATTAAQARSPVPGGLGCFTVVDRAACCGYTDGRADVDYAGQDCVAAKPGTSFETGHPGVVCQPSCWARGKCGDGGDQSDRIGECSGTSPPQARSPVPGGLGCFTVVDRAACCGYTDGRADVDYAGQDCVPAKSGTSFETGEPDVVCQPSCWARGTCGDGGDQSDRIGECARAPPPPPQARSPVPGGLGCFTVADRAACCGYTDGRADVDYAGQDCVATKPGTSFETGYPDIVCQPSCWARGTCGDGGDQSDRIGECAPAESPQEPAPPATPAPPAPALPPHQGRQGTVEQGGAVVPDGGQVRFYAVGSSNVAWQTWPDQLHAMLKDLGYEVGMPPLEVPAATTRPSLSPLCDNHHVFEELSTPRIGMVGWSSWGFAYDDMKDCDADGFRKIAGYPVSCTNAWACNPRWTGKNPVIPVSALARGVRDATFVVLSNWINDGKQAQLSGPRATCYNNSNIDFLGSTAVTESNLKRIIRAIHAENPDVVVLVFARYADTQGIVYPNEETLAAVMEVNAALQERLKDEPNTVWVDYSFPPGENMFQTLSWVHPNCRGDKILATAVLEKLFARKILARGLALGDAAQCLGNGACVGLDIPCCQRSALCYVADNGTCAAYGPGLQ